jgi:hypothetical protein
VSTQEYVGEQKSSVKISMTAKGEATVEVKVYDGADPAELDRIRGIAVSAYNATKAAVR